MMNMVSCHAMSCFPICLSDGSHHIHFVFWVLFLWCSMKFTDAMMLVAFVTSGMQCCTAGADSCCMPSVVELSLSYSYQQSSRKHGLPSQFVNQHFVLFAIIFSACWFQTAACNGHQTGSLRAAFNHINNAWSAHCLL
jgi:hypothetical protein